MREDRAGPLSSGRSTAAHSRAAPLPTRPDSRPCSSSAGWDCLSSHSSPRVAGSMNADCDRAEPGRHSDAVLTADSTARRTRHRSCDVRGCDGRTMRKPAGAEDPPAASARALGGTRCRPPDRASSAALRHREPRGRVRQAGTPAPGGHRCGALPPARGSGSRHPQTDRSPRAEYRWPSHLRGEVDAGRIAAAVGWGNQVADSTGCRIG